MTRNRSPQIGITWPGWRLGSSLIAVGVISAWLAAGRCLAQDDANEPKEPSHLEQYRLTVRPHEMATATRTDTAGAYTLDDIGPGPLVHVPPQCVGTRRCPLLLATNVPDEHQAAIANKYGIITAELYYTSAPQADSVIAAILRKFAIDPDKIALLGRCATGDFTAEAGAHNPDIFSRVLIGTTNIARDLPPRSPDQKVEYFLGIEQPGSGIVRSVWQYRALGYPIKGSIQFRTHTHTHEEYDFMGRWLQESWAIPDSAARPKPYTYDDPPLLTSEIVARMTAFWTRYMEDQPEVRLDAQNLMREVLIPIGKERASVLMVDMAALAARHPSVAAALQAANLTPEQHDVYRAALAGAEIYKNTVGELAYNPLNAKDTSIAMPQRRESVRTMMGVAPTSTVAKNYEFSEAHVDELSTLRLSMWRSQDDLETQQEAWKAFKQPNQPTPPDNP